MTNRADGTPAKLTPDEVFMNDIPEDQIYTAVGVGIMMGRLRALLMWNQLPILSEAVRDDLIDTLEAAHDELEAKAAKTTRPKAP